MDAEVQAMQLEDKVQYGRELIWDAKTSSKNVSVYKHSKYSKRECVGTLEMGGSTLALTDENGAKLRYLFLRACAAKQNPMFEGSQK